MFGSGGLRIWGLTRVMVMKCFNYVMLYLSFLYLSSPYLCVFGINHVTCYIGTYMDVGEHVDA